MNAIEFFDIWQKESALIKGILARLQTPAYDERVLSLWERGGLLSIDWIDGRLSRLWLNVVHHMTVFALLVEAFMMRLNAAGLSSSSTEAVQAGLVHDWSKRLEEEARERAREERNDPTATAEQKSKEGNEVVRHVLGEKVALFSGATGHSAIERADLGILSLEEKIVFYADCCVSNSRITTYKRRFDESLPHYQTGGRYAEVNGWFLARYGMTHRQKYDSVVIPLEQELASILQISIPEELPLVVAPPDLFAKE